MKAKMHNRKSKNSKLRQRNQNHFSILRFNLFRFSALAYSRLFFCIFASRRVAEWSRRWTLKPRCRYRCGLDPHVSVSRFQDYIVSFSGEKWLGGKTTIGHRHYIFINEKFKYDLKNKILIFMVKI